MTICELAQIMPLLRWTWKQTISHWTQLFARVKEVYKSEAGFVAIVEQKQLPLEKCMATVLFLNAMKQL